MEATLNRALALSTMFRGRLILSDISAIVLKFWLICILFFIDIFLRIYFDNHYWMSDISAIVLKFLLIFISPNLSRQGG